jgi:hypothetical protein
MPQVTNKGRQTTVECHCQNDKEPKELQRELYNDFEKIKSVGNYHSTDSGLTYNKLEYPESIKSDRVQVRYGDEGWIEQRRCH